MRQVRTISLIWSMANEIAVTLHSRDSDARMATKLSTSRSKRAVNGLAHLVVPLVVLIWCLPLISEMHLLMALKSSITDYNSVTMEFGFYGTINVRVTIGFKTFRSLWRIAETSRAKYELIQALHTYLDCFLLYWGYN